MSVKPETMNPRCERIKRDLPIDCRHATAKAAYWCLACKRQFTAEHPNGGDTAEHIDGDDNG